MHAQSENKFVWGDLGYLVPMRERAFQTMFEPPPGNLATNCVFDMRRCKIRDARQVASSMSLDETGFTLLDVASTVEDFYDDQELIRAYYPEIEALALELTGGARAVVFDHLLRQREEGRPSLAMGRPGDGSKPAAVGRVHNDYTEASGMARLNIVYPDHALGHPIRDPEFLASGNRPGGRYTLGGCDSRSFSSDDWIDCDIVYQNRTGQIYLAQCANAHRWYYYPKMRPAELLVFKTFDSRPDARARMTAHCAFDDVTADPDAPLRRSMEIRCLVMLEGSK